MVVAPEGGFALGYFFAAGGVVPVVGAVVDGVAEESVVFGVFGEVGGGEEGAGDGESGLVVVLGLGAEAAGEAEEALGGDGGGGAVDGLVGVVGFGGALEVVAHVGEAGGAGVPVGDAVGGGVGEVEVGGGAGGFGEGFEEVALGVVGGPGFLGEGLEGFELLGESEDGPGEAAGPRGEGGVALLGGGAAVGAVAGVEEGFVGGAAAGVVEVAAFAVVDGVARGVAQVLHGAVEEGDAGVALGHEGVAELVGEDEGAAGADGVDEEGVRAVEGVDESGTVGNGGPSAGLDRAGDLEGQGEAGAGVVGLLGAPGVGEAEEVAVGGDVVEAVVVDAGVADVAGHALEGVGAADVEEVLVAGGFELEELAAVLEALGPFGPAAGGVASVAGDDGGALGGIPGLVEAADFGPGEGEEVFEGGGEGLGGEAGVDLHGGILGGLPSDSVATSVAKSAKREIGNERGINHG